MAKSLPILLVSIRHLQTMSQSASLGSYHMCCCSRPNHIRLGIELLLVPLNPSADFSNAQAVTIVN